VGDKTKEKDEWHFRAEKINISTLLMGKHKGKKQLEKST
jgi:hypothetical protein